MTLVQMQQRPADFFAKAMVNAMDASGPQVGDDMTVEVALSVMTSARAGYLLICDGDGRCTGLITQAQLAAVRNSSSYTDRVRLRDFDGDSGSFISPVSTMAEAEHAMRYQKLGAVPVVDEHGCALGVLALAR
ncbi:CBS domain-containing protein [Streptomyces albipurpureus]